jgi:hypothetical protein
MANGNNNTLKGEAMSGRSKTVLKYVRRNLLRERRRNAQHADMRRARNDLAGENHFRGIVIGIEASIRELDSALNNLHG